MSEDVSLIPMHPFVQGFVYAILKTIREKHFMKEEKFVVDTSFVPRVSSRVMDASMGMRRAVPSIEDEVPRYKPKFVSRDMSELVSPIEAPARRVDFQEQKMNFSDVPVRPVIKPRPVILPPVQKRPVAPPIRAVPDSNGSVNIEAPMIVSEGAVDASGKYGKISPLLNDPSVSTIECLGAGQELMIIRAGQKQKTRIVLSADEIKEVLEKVADEAHIPLMEGVFRASVAGFSVSAVISAMIGSRFVVKKATAYGLLE